MPTSTLNRTPWEQRDLPEPLPYSFRNLIKMIGPGVILLSSSIGGGEWLVGPALAVKFGVQFMWIATISIALQVIFNLEGMRYTLYTGEPIYGGFLRLWPGAMFWAVVYCVLAFMSLGWPALALSSASTLFASFHGHLPGNADSGALYWIACGVIFLTLLILSFGGTIEKMLERAAYFMMGFVFLYLTAVNVIFIPWAHWWKTLCGFFQFTAVTGQMDWALMGAMAATAGSGGIGNLTVTSWARDKGFGMAKYVGAIPSAIGGRELKLSHVGKVFPVTAENLRRWKIWQKFVHADQLYLWGFFAFLGMFLNVNLATGVIPHGTELSGMATGAYQAQYMADKLWTGLWFLTLLNGFWILYSTHLGNTDLLVRTITDVLWMGSPHVRQWREQSIRKLYYTLLIPYTLFAFWAVRAAEPLTLFKLLANVAGFTLVVASVQIFFVNRRFLPREIRVPWREWALLVSCAFYLFFAVRLVVEAMGKR
ncbi:MAG: Nramp family divalent metal transporter [Verrucomicrobia bacterium]|nr:Nramp family divalent metal transporter [Verrucomicrobiota bacterium]